MTKYPFTITASNITVFVSGQIVKIPNTHSGFKALAEHLQGAEHDAETIMQLADKRKALARLTAGQVTVIGSTVYYRGVPIRSALSDRLIKLTDQGFDATPWALFMDKVMQNPSENSRERLFEFLDRWEAPLTPDGDFIAFKGVKADYSSTRTGPDGKTVYNIPGTVVEMPREQVVEDPNVTCASGLHACASHYLDSFWSTQNKVLALAINPRDVVSIPIDYNLSKMRVCRYEVIGDIEDTRHRDRIENAQVVDQNDAGRVVPVQPEPLILKQENRVEDGHFDEDGDRWVEVDASIEIGTMVVEASTGKVGKVVEEYEVAYDDDEHPYHDEWRGGDLAGNEIANVVYVEVEFLDGSIGIGTYDPNQPPSTYGFLPVEQIDPEEDDADFDEDDVEVDLGEDEPMSFYHEQTGRTFTAPQLTASVREIGQRGFARKYGVPRTTLQDWLRRALEAGY